MISVVGCCLGLALSKPDEPVLENPSYRTQDFLGKKAPQGHPDLERLRPASHGFCEKDRIERVSEGW